MTETNSSIVRGFFDEVINDRRLDLLPKYVSEEYVGHGTPYVGIGIAPDYSGGDKVTVKLVEPGGPSEGKLMVGDEILRIADGERTWETFDELRQSDWGPGTQGTSFTMWVRREGVEHEVSLERGLVPGFEFPYHALESVMSDWLKDWPDLKSRLMRVIEAGDLVAYHVENQGNNTRYGRAAVWAEFGFVRVQQGKITDWWITEDTFSQFTQLGYTIEGPAVGEA
jgi:hypothetical protein